MTDTPNRDGTTETSPRFRRSPNPLLFLQWADEIRSIANEELRWGNPNEYARRRCDRLIRLAAEIASVADERDVDTIETIYRGDLVHVTPYSGGDAAIFDDAGHVLLIQRRDDGLWAMPGGAFEVGEAPAEGVQREAREETGLEVEVVALSGVYDSRLCGTLSAHHLYHFVFLCRPRDPHAQPETSNETVAAGWYARHQLPDLSPGHATRTIRRKADRCDALGMVSLFPEKAEGAGETSDRREIPGEIRQLLVDLKAEHPAFRAHELARIAYVAFGRQLDSRTVQRVLASGLAPAHTPRRYPPYREIEDPVERRLAIIRLHAEGWNTKSIAGYLQTTRRRVYETLTRWIEEGVEGLDDKPPLPKQPPRKVDLRVMRTIQALQENPELGAFRVHAALKKEGIELSPRTCGRILALNRSLYRLPGPTAEPHEPKPMPFQASRRHQ